jgi:WG containing repeat
MRKIKIFGCLILLLAATGMQAQRYKVKTIFQLLGVENKKQPINSPASAKRGGDIYSEVAMDSKIGDEDELPDDDIQTTTAALADWLTKNPADTASLPSLTVYTLGFDYSNYALLNYTSAGYEMEDYNSKKIKKLGQFFYTSQAPHNGYGFNAYDENKNSMYYDGQGKLIFNHRFQYVEELTDKYYKIYEGKKIGIADSTGKIILPAKYDKALAFTFQGKPWFTVQDGDKTFFIEYGKAQPVMKNETGNPHAIPDFIAGRYWLLAGRVFDMQKREELFCNLEDNIDITTEAHSLLFIKRYLERDEDDGQSESERDREEKIFFDINGNLLFDQPVRESDRVGDSSYVIRVFDRDTMVKGKKYSLSKFGLANAKGTWIKKPVYDYMHDVTEGDAIVFITRPGLMSASGKILIPEGKYNIIDDAGKPGKFICKNGAISEVWDAATNTFTALEKNFFDIRTYTGLKKLGLMKAMAPRSNSYIIDTNYRLKDTTAWADIDVTWNSNLIACSPFVNGKKEYDAEKFYFTPSFQPVTVTYNGKTYNRFKEIDSLAPGVFFYRFNDGNNIVLTKEGKYFSTTCVGIEYDPFYNWYIGRGSRGTGILDNTGKELLPFSFSEIKTYSQLYRTASLSYDGETKLQQLEANGKLLFNGEYDNVKPITADYFIVAKNEVKGLLHRSGTVILPVKNKYLEIENGLIWYGYSEYSASSMPVSALAKK